MRSAALEAAGVGTREDFYWTLHAVFVKRHEHSLLFDQAFRIFFRSRAYLDKLIASLLPQAPPREPDAAAGPARSASRRRCSPGLRELEREKREVEIDARLTVSDRELLQTKDFAQMTAAEIAAAKAAIKRLVLSLDEVKTRRLAPQPPRPSHRHAPHAAREPQGRRRGDRPEISRAAHARRRRSWRCSTSPAR